MIKPLLSGVYRYADLWLKEEGLETVAGGTKSSGRSGPKQVNGEVREQTFSTI